MKILRLWTLLLVPIFSAQAFAQIDTLTVENDSADTEYMQEEETDDNALRVQVKGFLDTYHAAPPEGQGFLWCMQDMPHAVPVPCGLSVRRCR